MFMDVLRATPGSPSGCIDHAGLGQKLVGFWVTQGGRRAAFVRTAGGAKASAEAAFLLPMRCPRERRRVRAPKAPFATPTPENN